MIALWLASVALAQAPCTVLVAADAERPATVWTADGPVEGGVVHLARERVVAVGPPDTVDLDALDDCERVDTSGRVVTAGLVAVGTQLGLSEVGAEGASNDHDAGGDAIRASLVVTDAYNPASTAIPVTRREGVSSAVVYPTGGLVHGQAGWVDLAGGTQSEAVRASTVGLVITPRGASRAAAWRRLAELFDDAAFLARRGADFDRGSARPLSAGRLDLQVVQRVRDGELPLVAHVDRAADIEAALRFARDHGVRLVIHGGAEAWRHADALARAEVPVIVDAMLYGPAHFGAIHARRDNAARLAEAGVPLILGANQTHNARVVRQLAGDAVRSGLSWASALAALTEHPARAFGLDEHGALAAGRRANVVVWAPLDELPVDPFEPSTVPEAVWIGGVSRSLETRQTHLHDRYLELPGAPLPPLTLPDGASTSAR